MRLHKRLTVLVITVLVFILMILPYICHRNIKAKRASSSVVETQNTAETNQNVAALLNRNSVALVEVKTNKKYNFQLELELDKRERFERRKEKMMYKLERRRARVFDKTIDIDEPFPPRTEDVAKVKSYYNISERILTVLNSKFLMYNKALCSEIPELIVLIPSIPANENIRTAIRSTYGLFSRYTPSDKHSLGIKHPVKIAFLLGRSPNQSVEITVREEQKKYDDVVQIDFTDSYYNLTLKILYGFKWLNTFCKGVQYVLKADEDVFVNIRLLIAELKTYRVSDKGSVFGFFHYTSLGLRVLRTGKWGVTEEEYPLRRYPPYAQGTSYTLSGDLVPKILEVSGHLPYLHIEDAFITGIIAGSILGAKLENMIGNSYWTDETPDPCEFVKTERVSQTNMNPTLMYKTWQALISPESLCFNSTFRARVHRHNLHRINTLI